MLYFASPVPLRKILLFALVFGWYHHCFPEKDTNQQLITEGERGRRLYNTVVLSHLCQCDRFSSLLFSLAGIFITFLRMTQMNNRDSSCSLTVRVRDRVRESCIKLVSSHLC